MESNGEICHIQPHGTTVPIEARFIRGWRPYRIGNAYCHLIVDKKGDAIQVFSEDDGNNSICASIQIMNCYRLERYVCSRAPAQMKVVAHPAALRIGRASSIIPIENNSLIPSTYFNFIGYEHLRSRLNNHQLLTGKIDDTWYENTNNGTVMRLKIADPIKEPIHITLWPEIACSVNTEPIINADHHVVVAVTSLKVIEFRDKIRLESTSATHVYVDPDIDIAKSIASTFEKLEGPKLPGQTFQKTIQTIESPSKRNRTTIAALQSQNPSEMPGIAFTCHASVTAFNNRRSCYCLAATLADDTGSISVTIFDQAVTSVIGISCYEMVVQRGYTDTTIIPEPLLSIKGQDKIYRLERGSASSPFKVNRIFSVQEEASIPSTLFQTTAHHVPAPDTPVGKSSSLTDTKRQLSPPTGIVMKPIRRIFKWIAPASHPVGPPPTSPLVSEVGLFFHIHCPFSFNLFM
ncbi:hypothetical protein E3N88_10993 [Mikania micrantha]|uniref:Replication protein A OB domain-containing protein n=1 Tax=Mikania micrantha TaxID=192012 RepID=A0A5N6PDZ1_9ASTR|nr:hypothetical protein E3N88_10993 [Mikania micrantha]